MSSDKNFSLKKSLEKTASMVGNQLAKKFPTSKERRALAKRLFEHLQKGHSIFSFKEVHRNTLISYLDQHPEDFEGLHEALCDRMMLYESMALDLMTGKSKGNGAVFCKFMAAEFPATWQEKPVAEVRFDPKEFFANFKSKDIVNTEDNLA